MNTKDLKGDPIRKRMRRAARKNVRRTAAFHSHLTGRTTRRADIATRQLMAVLGLAQFRAEHRWAQRLPWAQLPDPYPTRT